METQVYVSLESLHRRLVIDGSLELLEQLLAVMSLAGHQDDWHDDKPKKEMAEQPQSEAQHA